MFTFNKIFVSYALLRPVAFCRGTRYCSGRFGQQPDLNAVLLRHPLICILKDLSGPHPPPPPETLTPHVEGICQEGCQSISEVCHIPQFDTALAKVPHARPRKEGFLRFISFYKTQTRKCESRMGLKVYVFSVSLIPFLGNMYSSLIMR